MTHPMFDLSGKVALVSGAASGLGKAMSMALGEAGADVVLMDLNEEGAQATASAIEALGRKVIPVRCDVSRPEEIRGVFARIDDEFGHIDFVGNVAGEAAREKPETIGLEDVEQTWRNLVYGRFCCCQEAGRRMLAAGGEASSTWGRRQASPRLAAATSLTAWRWVPSCR